MNFAKLFHHLLLFVVTEVMLGGSKRQDFSRSSELSKKIVKAIEGTNGGGFTVRLGGL